jgi:hypothetical protein
MHLQFTFPILGTRNIWQTREAGHFMWQDSFGWHDCSPTEDTLILDSIETREVYQYRVEGDSRGYFSTMEKAQRWRIDYATEFPMVNRMHWEIRKIRVPASTEVDLPMNWKRGS